MSFRSWRPTTPTGQRRWGRAFWVAGLTLGLGIALPGIAFADAGKPIAVKTRSPLATPPARSLS